MTACRWCGVTEPAKTFTAAKAQCVKCDGSGSVGTGEWERVYAGDNPKMADYDREITVTCDCVSRIAVCESCCQKLRDYHASTPSRAQRYSDRVFSIGYGILLTVGLAAVWVSILGVGWKILSSLLLVPLVSGLVARAASLGVLRSASKTDPLELRKGEAERWLANSGLRILYF